MNYYMKVQSHIPNAGQTIVSKLVSNKRNICCTTTYTKNETKFCYFNYSPLTDQKYLLIQRVQDQMFLRNWISSQIKHIAFWEKMVRMHRMHRFWVIPTSFRDFQFWAHSNRLWIHHSVQITEFSFTWILRGIKVGKPK